MFALTVAVSIVLAVVLSGSAYAKLTRDPKVVESIVGKVGFPEERLWVLAALEVAAAAGLIVGLFWAPLGIAAAIGVILYFICALIGHLRVRDTAVQSLAPPTVLLLVGIATLALRAATA
jgi:DoxX-like protein